MKKFTMIELKWDKDSKGRKCLTNENEAGRKFSSIKSLKSGMADHVLGDALLYKVTSKNAYKITRLFLLIN